MNNFYQSKQWIKLLQVIKSERLNESGEIICEHCGLPIVKAYDCIGHHKIELTPENVGDYNISLNPENIALVHHKCHNKIHNKLGYSGRKVYIVYGSPLSGKTSYVNSVKNEGDLIVDMDNIWQCISGCERYVKPNRLKSIVFGVRDKLIEDIKYRRGKWLCAYIIGGYPLISERERLSREIGAELVFIDTSKEECISRLDDKRGEDWIAYIEEWWRLYSPPL